MLTVFRKMRNLRKFFGGGYADRDSRKEKIALPNDKCVLCGNDTDVPKDTPIENRKEYVKGSGQLCRDCYFDIYIKSDSDGNTIPNERGMKRLLKMSRKE